MRGTRSGGEHQPKGRWLAAAAALVVVFGLAGAGLATPETSLVRLPASALSATTFPGDFTNYTPPELYGGGSPDETCFTCVSASVEGGGSGAQSIDPTNDVDAGTGDFSLTDKLVTVPAFNGSLGVSVSYDTQQAAYVISGTSSPTSSGNFGWGWTSSLTWRIKPPGSLPGAATVVATNTSQVTFTPTPSAKDGCPVGDYRDFQKYTVNYSTVVSTLTGTGTSLYPFCAANRVNAQLGNFSWGWEYQEAGGSVKYTFTVLGKLTDIGNNVTGNAIQVNVAASPGHTTCPSATTVPTIKSCIIEVTKYVSRKFIESLAGPTSTHKHVTQLKDPAGNVWTLAYATDNLHSIKTPTAHSFGTTRTLWRYAYNAVTHSSPDNHQLTTIFDGNTHKTEIRYNTTDQVSTVFPAEGGGSHYSYAPHGCGTTVACAGVNESEVTTVTYPTLDTEVNRYYEGLLTSSVYGTTTNNALNHLSWTYNYSFPGATNQDGVTTETIVHPGAAQSVTTTVVTTDSVGNVLTTTNVNGGVTTSLYNDTGGHDLSELCWTALPGVSVSPTASCSEPPPGATTYTYNQYGGVATETDPLGNTTRYGYYATTDLVCWVAPPTVPPTGSTTTCTDTKTSATFTSVSGAPAGATTTTYNHYGESTTQDVAEGTASSLVTTSSYTTSDGRLTYTVPPPGASTGAPSTNPYHTYDQYYSSGRLYKSTAPTSLDTTYAYDLAGDVTWTDTPAGFTDYGYDTDDRVCWTKQWTAAIAAGCTGSAPATTTKTTYWHDTSAPTKVTDADGHWTQYYYSDLAYPTQATEVQEETTGEIEYDIYNAYGGLCVSGPTFPYGGARGTHPACTWLSGDTGYTDNAAGTELSTENPTGQVTTYSHTDPAYDTLVTKTVNAAGATTSYSYDATGHLLKVTEPGGLAVSYGYDADGRKCWQAPKALTGSCITVAKSDGVSTYSYNTADELTTMVDYTGATAHKTSTYTYTGGELTSTTNDNNATTSYLYSRAGEELCLTYPVHLTSSCGTLSSRGTPSSTNTIVNRTYTAGRLTATTDWVNPSHSTTYSYGTTLHQADVTKITYPSTTSEHVTYTYDPAGNLTKTAYSGPAVGTTVDSFTYNGDNQLATASVASGALTSTDKYNGHKQVTRSTDPIGTNRYADSYTENPDGTVTKATSSTTDYKVTLSYNSADELTSRTLAQSIPHPNKAGTALTVPTGTAVFSPTTSGPGSTSHALYVSSSGTAKLVKLPTMTVTTTISGLGTNIDAGLASTGPLGITTLVVAHASGTTISYVSGPIHTIKTLTVGSNPVALAWSHGPTLFVVNKTSGTVSQVHTGPGTWHVTRTITVGSKPDAIAETSQGKYAYVANETSGTVTPITVVHGTAGTPITVGSHPDAVAVTGSTAYVANAGSDTITPITLTHDSTSTAISLTFSPQSIGAAGGVAYVGNKTRPTVTPITMTHDSIETIVTVGTQPTQISTNAIPGGPPANPVSAKVYVLNSGSHTVTPITVTGVTSVTSSAAYAYTAAGQRCRAAPSTAKACATVTTSTTSAYGWDAYGQLCYSGATSAAETTCFTHAAPGSVTTYTYDGSGLRMTESHATGKTYQFTWDSVSGGGQPLDIDDHYDAYVYGPLLFGGTAPVEEISLTASPKATYLSSTPSGVQLAFQHTGSSDPVLEKALYSTFGTQDVVSGSAVSAFGYQGSYKDPSGLLYLVNRYYTPKTYQFMSIDPDVAQTGQPYAYTGDDPLNATDPLGLHPLSKIEEMILKGQQIKGGKRGGNFPKESDPNDVLYRMNDKGITSYEVYGAKGQPLKRVDLQGAPHNTVPTPHTVKFRADTAPTGKSYYHQESEVTPATPDEIPSQGFQDALLSGTTADYAGTAGVAADGEAMNSLFGLGMAYQVWQTWQSGSGVFGPCKTWTGRITICPKAS